MPSTTQGLSGTEILQHLKDYTGNQSAVFASWLTTAIALAEFRFCKIHDWTFLTKANLTLTVASGTQYYNLSVATIGYYIAASDVRNIWSPAGNKPLIKTTLEQIRRMDPDGNDGSTSQYPTHWAPVGDNEIAVWPATFAGTTLKVDGKVTPNALLTLSNYPTIPFRYQDTFVEYLKAIALDREDDNRASGQRLYVERLVRQDIQDDMSALGDTEDPRIKSQMELLEAGLSPEQSYALWAFNP